MLPVDCNNEEIFMLLIKISFSIDFDRNRNVSCGSGFLYILYRSNRRKINRMEYFFYFFTKKNVNDRINPRCLAKFSGRKRYGKYI